MKNLRILLSIVLLSSALVFLQSATAAAPALTKISRDPYTNTSSQHRTQVEPDTFAYGSTVVAVFQSGRFYDGGASNIGWATSGDNGATWTYGFLPNTTAYAGGAYQRISDPSIAYDAKHAAWLVNTLGIGSAGQSILAHRSTDGGLSWDNPILIDGPGFGLDKNWIACDNAAASPYYGNCYASWDDANNGGVIYVSVSSGGGVTWSTPTFAFGSSGLGVQPLALPDGTVVIPYLGFNNRMYVIRSMDGGATWSAPQNITTVTSHNVAGDLRTVALPSAEMDGGGKIYLAWQDCRFIKNCKANDIVMTTSTDGVNWSAVKRIPLDRKNAGVDHFIPGIAADPNTSGNTAHLALAYYFYPSTSCSVTTCRLNVGFATSADSGATWSERIVLARGMKLKWLPYTTLGYMVGDYISTSFVNGQAIPVFARALEKKNKFRQATYAPTNGLPVRAGVNAATLEPVETTQSDHAPLPIQIRP
ncbi:MAG: exo-alpha-sialidase [Chloroflexi bacterium]|nr:exo-alpha-sialidase [Chloroflexota bacterium]